MKKLLKPNSVLINYLDQTLDDVTELLAELQSISKELKEWNINE